MQEAFLFTKNTVAVQNQLGRPLNSRIGERSFTIKKQDCAQSYTLR
jgi:hypothetical protein